MIRAGIISVSILSLSSLGAIANSPAQTTSTPDVIGGFRLETDPKIEPVFADAAQYRRHVDRFFMLYAEMERAREEFSRNLQTVLAVLTQSSSTDSSVCAAAVVAQFYQQAVRQSQNYHELGRNLEVQFGSIRHLDGLGETKGLSPEYRWKVTRALKLYSSLLADFREMKLSQSNLAGELTYRGCDPQVLLAHAEELGKTEKNHTLPTSLPTTNPTTGDQNGKRKSHTQPPSESAPPSLPVATVTFGVDNSLCGHGLRVYLDGSLLGEVLPKTKANYQTVVGRHELCLIPTIQAKQCGDPGTVRKVHVHDGWTIMLQCDQ